jgi:hypothetical protein
MTSPSLAAPGKSPWLTNLRAGIGLAVAFGVLLFTQRLSPGGGGPFTVASAVGFLLLGGMLAAQLLDAVGLPHLTAYLAVGVVSGPHV